MWILVQIIGDRTDDIREKTVVPDTALGTNRSGRKTVFEWTDGTVCGGATGSFFFSFSLDNTTVYYEEMMKDEELKLRDLHVSHSLGCAGDWNT